MTDFLKFFAVQCVQYFLITANYRAIAQGSYAWTAGTDFMFAGINFMLIKKIADSDKNRWAWAGYTLGGVVGSLGAIYLTKLVYGK